MRISWLIFISIFTPVSAYAGNPCDDPATATTIEINQCGKSSFQAADKKLNAAYQAALHRIGSELASEQQQIEIRQDLSEAQRLWIQFRDKDCAALYNFANYGEKAEIRDSLHWSCMIERTEQRTDALNWFGLH